MWQKLAHSSPQGAWPRVSIRAGASPGPTQSLDVLTQKPLPVCLLGPSSFQKHISTSPRGSGEPARVAHCGSQQSPPEPRRPPGPWPPGVPQAPPSPPGPPRPSPQQPGGSCQVWGQRFPRCPSPLSPAGSSRPRLSRYLPPRPTREEGSWAGAPGPLQSRHRVGPSEPVSMDPGPREPPPGAQAPRAVSRVGGTCPDGTPPAASNPDSLHRPPVSTGGTPARPSGGASHRIPARPPRTAKVTDTGTSEKPHSRRGEGDVATVSVAPGPEGAAG